MDTYTYGGTIGDMSTDYFISLTNFNSLGDSEQFNHLQYGFTDSDYQEITSLVKADIDLPSLFPELSNNIELVYGDDTSVTPQIFRKNREIVCNDIHCPAGYINIHGTCFMFNTVIGVCSDNQISDESGCISAGENYIWNSIDHPENFSLNGKCIKTDITNERQCTDASLVWTSAPYVGASADDVSIFSSNGSNLPYIKETSTYPTDHLGCFGDNHDFNKPEGVHISASSGLDFQPYNGSKSTFFKDFRKGSNNEFVNDQGLGENYYKCSICDDEFTDANYQYYKNELRENLIDHRIAEETTPSNISSNSLCFNFDQSSCNSNILCSYDSNLSACIPCNYYDGDGTNCNLLDNCYFYTAGNGSTKCVPKLLDKLSDNFTGSFPTCDRCEANPKWVGNVGGEPNLIRFPQGEGDHEEKVRCTDINCGTGKSSKKFKVKYTCMSRDNTDTCKSNSDQPSCESNTACQWDGSSCKSICINKDNTMCDGITECNWDMINNVCLKIDDCNIYNNSPDDCNTDAHCDIFPITNTYVNFC